MHGQNVTCSCGAVGFVVWSEALQKYVSQSAGWKFREQSTAPGVGVGWYCGKKNHSQAYSLP